MLDKITTKIALKYQLQSNKLYTTNNLPKKPKNGGIPPKLKKDIAPIIDNNKLFL